MLRTLITCCLWMVSAQRSEASCPWGDEVESAYATMTTVTVNGKTFSVKGEAARAQFVSILAECGDNGIAAATFQDWRSMRRWTNISAVVGLCCVWPVLLATPVTAVLAGEKKMDLIMLLQTSGQ